MNPSSRGFRLTILGLASFMLFGSYFAFDSVGAIAPSLIDALHADRAAKGRPRARTPHPSRLSGDQLGSGVRFGRR